MKKFICMWTFILLLLAVIPAAFCRGNGTEEKKASPPPEHTGETVDTIRVYLAAEDRTEEMSLRDYLIGVTAAEMPASFEHDALCAQALASLSYALYQKHAGNGGLPGGADVSTDPAVHQAYLSEDGMRETWGDSYEEYHDKISGAVDEILPYEITYNDEPAAAAFHAISPGRTESAENMWGTDEMPYLTTVESEGDSVSPKYRTSLTVNAKEAAAKLGIKTDSPPAEWFGETEYSDAGTLLKVDILGRETTGRELRELFGLQSAAITISCAEESVTFDVKGYGHGVGLSQYGADYYARQGMNWREITEHYYPGTEIRER